MLPIVFHPDYEMPLRRGHRFPMSKYGYLKEELVARHILQPGKYLSPSPASQRNLELAHDPIYVERVFSMALTADQERRIGLPLSSKLVRRSRLSAAGTTLAAWLALDAGIACNCAGGSHHAASDFGAGFCVFNDVAVAARSLLAQGVPGPFLVVDADVHQGDGTALIFESDDAVITLSLHAEKNFPQEKARSNFDVSLPDGLSDEAYLGSLRSALDRVLTSTSPSLAFYNAGVDVHEDDKLGRLSVSDDGLRARDAMVLSAMRDRDIPVVGVLGGGYADDPRVVAARHAVLFEEALRLKASPS